MSDIVESLKFQGKAHPPFSFEEDALVLDTAISMCKEGSDIQDLLLCLKLELKVLEAERNGLREFAERLLVVHEDRDRETAKAIIQQVIDAAKEKP